MSWSILLSTNTPFDKGVRFIIISVLFVWILFVASPFEIQYHEKLIELYAQPAWRALLATAVFFSLMWCPRIGILLTLALFFYFHDIGAIVQN